MTLLPSLLSLDHSPAITPASADPFAGLRPRSRAAWRLVEHLGGERRSAEEFITRRYRDSLGADIEAFMPRLFTLRDSGGAICGALGLRSAHHRLFAERYLDVSVERAIARSSGCAVERQAIVEVGHFCGAFAGAMRLLIELLTERLHDEGQQWVAFTSTTALRNAFTRVGLRPIDLGPAPAEKLSSDERRRWGRYYDHAPRVSAGRVEIGMRAFAQQRAPAGTSGEAGA